MRAVLLPNQGYSIHILGSLKGSKTANYNLRLVGIPEDELVYIVRSLADDLNDKVEAKKKYSVAIYKTTMVGGKRTKPFVCRVKTPLRVDEFFEHLKKALVG